MCPPQPRQCCPPSPAAEELGGSQCVRCCWGRVRVQEPPRLAGAELGRGLQGGDSLGGGQRAGVWGRADPRAASAPSQGIREGRGAAGGGGGSAHTTGDPRPMAEAGGFSTESVQGPAQQRSVPWGAVSHSPVPVPSLPRFVAHELHEALRAHGLGSLQGEAQRPAPDELREDAQGPGDPKKHRVVVHLLHPVILQGERGPC